MSNNTSKILLVTAAAVRRNSSGQLDFPIQRTPTTLCREGGQKFTQPPTFELVHFFKPIHHLIYENN